MWVQAVAQAGLELVVTIKRRSGREGQLRRRSSQIGLYHFLGEEGGVITSRRNLLRASPTCSSTPGLDSTGYDAHGGAREGVCAALVRVARMRAVYELV